MGNRSLLCGAATVEVNMTRYDELVRKEEKLSIIENLLKDRNVSIEIFNLIMDGDEVAENE